VSSLIYFSHSYRPRDVLVNDYFTRLMKSEDLLPSLDPPSASVNSAKLERHLAQSDAMIAVLTDRESGISPHIHYEIALGVRSRKPLLVFVEDTLPSNVLPARILQRRFSLNAFPRHIREHRQSLKILRDYSGDPPPPRYQYSLTPRTCLLLGGSSLDAAGHDELRRYIEESRRYEVLTSAEFFRQVDEHPIAYELLREIDLVIAITSDAESRRDSYLLGVAQGACMPLVNLSTGPAFPASGEVPDEYRPRNIGADFSMATIRKTLDQEINLYEEDFLNLEDASSTDRYIQFLIDLDGSGQYAARTRRAGMDTVLRPE
jgi:hypothetical protein